MTTLVDSNVLLDLVTGDPAWINWSAGALRHARASGELVINAVIFSEVAAAFLHIEEVDSYLDQSLYRQEDIPWAAAFLAGQAFREYRRRGGIKTATLPDFLIGAH